MVTTSSPLVEFFGKLRITIHMTDEELAQLIGANVRAARTARDMTQAALGEATKIPVPHISRLEKGSHLPSVATLKKVAEALEVPICSLLDSPKEVGKKSRKSS
jgi:transcriptional regulator with XRE-family HTH domain